MYGYTPCNYGGERRWLLCPRCFKRVAKLYRPPDVAARKRQVPIVAIVLCCIGIAWVVASASYRYESAQAQRIADGFNAMQAAAVADDASPGGINHKHQLEEKIEQDAVVRAASCAAGAGRWLSVWRELSRACTTIRPQIMTIRGSAVMSLSIRQQWPASTGD